MSSSRRSMKGSRCRAPTPCVCSCVKLCAHEGRCDLRTLLVAVSRASTATRSMRRTAARARRRGRWRCRIRRGAAPALSRRVAYGAGMGDSMTSRGGRLVTARDAETVLRVLRRVPRSRRSRCGARCRDGHPCSAPVVMRRDGDGLLAVSRRCRMHGGLSTGPRTAEGRARSLAALARGRSRALAARREGACSP